MDRWDHPLYLQWLDSLPTEAAEEVASAVDYLTEFGRGAQLDLVRHRIQPHATSPTCPRFESAIRPGPYDLIMRVLTVFAANDAMLIVCFAGDKAKWARHHPTDWYSAAVPIADQVFDRYLQIHQEPR